MAVSMMAVLSSNIVAALEHDGAVAANRFEGVYPATSTPNAISGGGSMSSDGAQQQLLLLCRRLLRLLRAGQKVWEA